MSTNFSNADDESAQRLRDVRSAIDTACAQAGREPSAVALLAVSKTWPALDVQRMALAGQRQFGENYIQEGVDKIVAVRDALQTELPDAVLVWHCIGPIQSNKTALVAQHFDWVHSVDRLKIAQRLSDQRPAGMAPLQVCVQVNVDGAQTKSGVALAEATELARQVAQMPRLQLRGLMCIPDPCPDGSAPIEAFATAAALYQSWQDLGLGVDTLSMGMSADLSEAVAAGSTMVRVGTALFGQRTYAAN